MKKKKARKGSETTERFVKLPNAWIDSAAFRSLPARAVAVAVYLLRGWRPGGTYTLPARQIAWRFHHGTRERAIADLIKAGFFDCVDHGGRFPRRPAVFKTSERYHARSQELMLDAAAGKSQKKLGWVPIRERKPKTLALFKRPKKTRPTKAATNAAANAYLRAEARRAREITS